MAITPQQINELKTAIKNEVKRRNGYGDISKFSGSQYDFTSLPAYGAIKKEWGEKTIDILLQICDHGDLRLTKVDDAVPQSFDNDLIDFVKQLATETATGSVDDKSSCRGACTGLCVGSCVGKCNGCQGCSASCGTGCAGGVMVSSR